MAAILQKVCSIGQSDRFVMRRVPAAGLAWNGLQSGVPAGFAEIVGIHKEIGVFAAPPTFELHGARNPANAQAVQVRLALDPASEIQRDVAIVPHFAGGLFFVGGGKKGPGPQQKSQPHNNSKQQTRVDHFTPRIAGNFNCSVLKNTLLQG